MKTAAKIDFAAVFFVFMPGYFMTRLKGSRMPHATARSRQIWVALLAFALLSACAPQRPKAKNDALKTGQEVSEAAAKSTHETDIDALVLSSSSMDADAGEDDTPEVEEPEVATPDAGLSTVDIDASEDTGEDADTARNAE